MTTAPLQHRNNSMTALQPADKEMRKKAHTAVAQAVRTGRLPRAKDCSCHICGKKASVYHHPSYAESLRLDVTALCAGCHKLIHNKVSIKHWRDYLRENLRLYGWPINSRTSHRKLAELEYRVCLAMELEDAGQGMEEFAQLMEAIRS